jgi:hypothetical protein
MANTNDISLFKKLTRLFSGPLMDRNTRGTHRLKRKYFNKYQFQQAPWNKSKESSMRKSDYHLFKTLNLENISERSRNQRYVEFESMEFMPEIGAALDIYADEMTTWTDSRPILKISSPNEEIMSILETLFYDTLDAKYNLRGWCRNTIKFGDFFLYVHAQPDTGVEYVVGLPPNQIRRLENLDPDNPRYYKFKWEKLGHEFEAWQMAHFRLSGNERYMPYGVSVLETSRRIWRQLTLLEDSMMAYRIVRSPERRVFYVDVSAVHPKDVPAYIEKVRTEMKRNQVINDTTGEVNLRYNPLSIDEDYIIPVRGGNSATKISTLEGGKYVGDIEDVKYLRNKLFAALKVPQSYLADNEAKEHQDSLSQKDIKFARTIARLQLPIITELTRIAQLHLALLNYRGKDLVNFEISLNTPSKILELQEIEHLERKMQAATAAEKHFSRWKIAQEIFGWSQKEFERNNYEMMTDRKFNAALDTITAENSPVEGEGMPEGGPGS